MIVIYTDGTDDIKEITNFLNARDLKFHVLPAAEIKQGIKDSVKFIVYDTRNLTKEDIENIHLAKESNIPILLITAYPDEHAVEEISRLWRYNYIENYLIRPVDMERFSTYFPMRKRAV